MIEYMMYNILLTGLCKIATSNQEVARFLQAKSNASALLTQVKNTQEYMIMTEMLQSINSDEEDEHETSESSNKTVDLDQDEYYIPLRMSKKKKTKTSLKK